MLTQVLRRGTRIRDGLCVALAAGFFGAAAGAVEPGTSASDAILRSVTEQADRIRSGRFEYVRERTRYDPDGESFTESIRYAVVMDGEQIRFTRTGDTLVLFAAGDLRKAAAQLHTAAGTKALIESGAARRVSDDKEVLMRSRRLGYCEYARTRNSLHIHTSSNGFVRAREGYAAFVPQRLMGGKWIVPERLAEMVAKPPIGETLEGREVVHLEYSGPDEPSEYYVHVWVDPARSVAEKILQVGRLSEFEGGLRRVVTYTYDGEPGARIGYPAKVVEERYEGAHLARRTVTRIVRAEINVSIDEAEFTLQAMGIDKGTPVVDEGRKAYVGTWDGSRVVPSKERHERGGYLGVKVCGSHARGCPIAEVFPDSPAAKAGLRAGDVITKLDGEPAHGVAEFCERIARTKAGAKVLLTVLRGDAVLSVPVVLGRWPERLPVAEGTRQEALVGRGAPALAGKDLSGHDIRLADLKGQVVVVDFWAHWCSPCVAALPHLQKISERYADKGVTVIGVNQDDAGSREKVDRLLREKQIGFRQIPDRGGEWSRAFGVSSVPSLVLIDKRGIVQEIQVGWGPGHEERVAALIDRLVAAKP
jgi:thiol-disulfide isomerase/thioredoxin